MKTRYSISGGALAAMLLSSTASFADVTPSDVWGNWRDYMAAYGYGVSATESMSGSTLTISDLAMVVQLPEEEITVTISFGDMGFVDQGNGTVMVALPPTWPIQVDVNAEGEEPVEISIDYNTTGLSMIASGSIDAMTYSYSADVLSMALTEILADGKRMGPDTIKAVISLSNLSGSTQSTGGSLKSLVQTMTASSISYDVDIHEPEGSGNFAFMGQAINLQSNMSFSMPEGVDMQDMSAALKAGLAVSGQVAIGAGNSEFSFVDGGDTASGNSTTTGTTLGFGLDANHLQYAASVMGVVYHIIGSEIPFPINVAANEIGFDLSMPVAKSSSPSDFSLVTKIVDLAPDALIWGMLDPSNALPHGPGTIIIDVAGKMNWLFDILDPEQAAMMDDIDVPAEIHALTINNLTVSAAGATLTGAGSFTFDNNDMETFDGIPAPDGSVDLKVVGANGLIDGLIGMGMMSDDDAMGARMMLGLFGRPGEGEDTVLSTLEVKSNGQIFANGQRIQ